MAPGEILSGGGGEGHRTEAGRPNWFAGGAIDRAANRRGDPEWVAAWLPQPSTRVVPVWESSSFVLPVERADGPGFDPVLLDATAARAVCGDPAEWIFLGLEPAPAGPAGARRALFAAGAMGPAPDPTLLPVGTELHDLHRIGATLSRADGSTLAYARAVVTWSRRHRYCGTCGSPTVPREGGHVRRCVRSGCETDQFPRTDPAIIVLVTDGDLCLLGRKDAWPAGVYSTLAGFVEPGESLAEAVAREVREESGIEVGRVRYRSSQPWPFPTSLMLGFHAERIGGELRVDGIELADARWFRRDELARRAEGGPRLPSRVSIARRLIEEWLDPESWP